jgi:hypothetical protein
MKIPKHRRRLLRLLYFNAPDVVDLCVLASRAIAPKKKELNFQFSSLSGFSLSFRPVFLKVDIQIDRTRKIHGRLSAASHFHTVALLTLWQKGDGTKLVTSWCQKLSLGGPMFQTENHLR